MFSDHTSGLPKSTTPKERQERIELASKNTSFNNPCIKEQQLSYKCLSENDYDQKICEPVFANYVTCQKFWTKVKQDRRRKGISPAMPWPDDRDRIKSEYRDKWKC